MHTIAVKGLLLGRKIVFSKPLNLSSADCADKLGQERAEDGELAYPKMKLPSNALQSGVRAHIPNSQSECTLRKQKILKSRYNKAHSVHWQCRIAY